MSKPDKTLTVIEPSAGFQLALGGSVQLNNTDVLAIAVSEFELEQESIIEQAMKDLQLNTKTQEELRTKIIKSIQAAADDDSKAHDGILKPLRDFGFKVRSVAYNPRIDDEAPREISYAYQVSLDNKEGNTQKGNCSISKPCKLKTPAAILTMRDDLEAARKDQAEIEKRGAEARYKLSRLPQIQRQAQAKLARALLSKTEEGRAILNDLFKVA